MITDPGRAEQALNELLVAMTKVALINHIAVAGHTHQLLRLALETLGDQIEQMIEDIERQRVYG
jgi:hypothetical protein